MGKDEYEDRTILSGPITFKEDFDAIKNLSLFDTNTKLCYKKDEEEFIKKEAALVQTKYEKGQKMPVTLRNLKESMFTVCLYDNSESQRGKGVLLATKLDSDGSTLLLFRQIQMRQCQKDKLEWIKLVWNPSSSVSHVESEFNRGFVSIDYLKTLDNSFGTGVKLRTKYITFVSHEASLI
jgi:hypothetical protein